MKALKVNGDYETELFHGKHGSPIINESLEFLAFYLSELPILTAKKYSSEYLDHVESVTGRKPLFVQKGPSLNWWGALRDLDHERWMNSKLTSAELNIKNGWAPDTYILHCPDELKSIRIKREFLIKDPYGMSGRGIRSVNSSEEIEKQKSFPCVLEPLLQRKFDFSHYVYPAGQIIAYENLVDRKFQYRGTLFRNRENPVIGEMGFASRVEETEWVEFKKALEIVRKHYSAHPLHSGFSIDSFVYEERGKLKIHHVCEVNYRRTLGSTAFELACLYGKGGPWSCFTLARMATVDFKSVKQKLEQLKNVLMLSPADVRYQMFLLSAPSHSEGKKLFADLKVLLPEAQFSVNIED